MPLRIIGCSLIVYALTASAQAQIAPVTLQWFESSWPTMADRTADAFMAGYERAWTPPPGKAGSGYSAGYDVFDRFDFGAPGDETHYGTRGGFDAVVFEQNKANIGTFIDLVLNHNGYGTSETPGFVAAGDYPGFVLSYDGDPNGDFHAKYMDCGSNPLICRLAGLIDIDQSKNHWMIRHPVTPGDPLNIPGGTIYDRPADSNRQYYSDTDLPPDGLGIHPFNLADPMAGDPVIENATALLMRNVRWLLEVVGVDGFRIDAAVHVPDWFWRDFYDRHVYLRGPTDLAGNPQTPFSFVEAWWGQADYVCKDTTGNCNTDGGVRGNRDALDMPLFAAMRSELDGSGLGSWHNIVNASVDSIFDGNTNDGDFGVTFVSSHDDYGAAMDNLAYAYILTRPGSPNVYFNAEQFGPTDFPKPGRGDALGGAYGDILTTLIDIHNEYVRGAYIERWIDDDVLVFERDNAVLVCLSDRNDNGYDERSVQTSFPEGTRLHELTGNARNPAVDPADDIDDVLTVGTGGWVTVRVPRNRNIDGQTHSLSYVIYGPANPDGTLTVTGVAETIPADPAGTPNATRRLTPIDIIREDAFEVRLQTRDADPLDDGEDDLAMVRMDAGMDINGNGVIDNLDPDFSGYGYEAFVTENCPLNDCGADGDAGIYRQVIDATRLSEGRHYLSAIAFRSRPAGTPTIHETWRKVLLIDRVPPDMRLSRPSDGETINGPVYRFVVNSPDRTASRAHVFLDQPEGTDLIAMAEAGQGLASRGDGNEFTLTSTSLRPGLHRIDVVAYEDTRPDGGVTTFSGIPVIIDGFDGLGDINNDGRVDNFDIAPFVAMVQQGNAFNPGADFDGNGVIDQEDVPLFARRLRDAGLWGQDASGSVGTPSGSTFPLMWLQTDGQQSGLGSVSNPVIEVEVGREVSLYAWLTDDGLVDGFDGVSLDVRLSSSTGGQASAAIAIDPPPGIWESASNGSILPGTGGDGVDDANAFDLTNTDTFEPSPLRFAELTFTGRQAGLVNIHLCVGGLGIADNGEPVAMQFGFAGGQAVPETTPIMGDAFGVCSSVPEATLTVTGGMAAADFDVDGDVDMEDFGHLQACLLGRTVPQTDPQCANASIDGDEFVDQADVELFRGCLTGANIAADPDCVTN